MSYQLFKFRRYFSRLMLGLLMSALLLPFMATAAQPEIINIKARSEPSQIKIDFNMPLSPWSAIATGNYYISDGVRTLDARLSTDRTAVLLDTTPLNENGTYKLLTFNLLGDSESDTAPPLFSVQSTDDPNLLNVVFNQPVSPDSAENIDNYSITKGTEIVSATLSDDYLTVVLQVTPALSANSTQTLVVENVSRLRPAPAEFSIPEPGNNENGVDPNNPLPVITLSADAALIEYNNMARISWEVENATSCVGSGAWSGYKPTSGTRNIGPLKGNSVFFLTCRGPNGSATKFITVSVLAAEQPALTFSANKMTLPSNTKPVISWAVEDATNCTASGDWSGEKAAQGSEQLGLLTEDITLFLTCRGAGGSTMQSLNIAIAKPPAIMLRTSRNTIGYLGVTTLNWYATDAEICQGSGTDTGASPPTCGGLGIDSSHNKNNYYNTSEWYKSPLETQGTLSVGPLCVDTTFFLTCTGPGGTTTDFVDVKVLESQPDIRLNANRAYAKPGEKITLTWETLRVNSCTASGGWSGTKSAFPTNSEMVGSITEDTVFTLTCKDDRGRSAERFVKVRVKTDTPSSTDNSNEATPVNNQPQSNPVAVTTEKDAANDLNPDDANNQSQRSGFIDLNNNGKNDEEEGMCNLYDALEKTVVSIQASQGTLRCLNTLGEDELVTAIQSDGEIDSIPYGLFNFQIEQLPANTQTTEVTFYFENPLPPESLWYQYNKATDALEVYTDSVNVDGNKVIIQITDGGPGDSGGLINGIIANPAGPIIPMAQALTKPVLAQDTAPTTSEKYGIGGNGAGFLILLLLALIRRRSLA